MGLPLITEVCDQVELVNRHDVRGMAVEMRFALAEPDGYAAKPA